MEVNFELKTDLEPIQNFVLEANFNECKTALEKMLQPYVSMIVSEHEISAAKKDRAKIRAMTANIEAYRKTVKKVYMKSYEKFEIKCKELVALCDNASDNIDKQIKEFEESRKQEKLDKLKSVFEESICDMKSFLTWEDIFNPRWLNVSYPLDRAETEICAAISNCRKDVDAIRTLSSEFIPALLSLYRQNHDIGACIKKNAELVALKYEENARELENEDKKATYVTDSGIRNTTPFHNENEAELVQKSQEAQGHDCTQKFELDFRVYVTKAEMQKLRSFLYENNIIFCRVPKGEN